MDVAACSLQDRTDFGVLDRDQGVTCDNHTDVSGCAIRAGASKRVDYGMSCVLLDAAAGEGHGC